MIDNIGTDIYTALLIIIFFILAFLLIVKLTIIFEDFNRERKYIKSEIRRTHGMEQRYWRREMIKLWLSLIPFYKR